MLLRHMYANMRVREYVYVCMQIHTYTHTNMHACVTYACMLWAWQRETFTSMDVDTYTCMHVHAPSTFDTAIPRITHRYVTMSHNLFLNIYSAWLCHMTHVTHKYMWLVMKSVFRQRFFVTMAHKSRDYVSNLTWTGFIRTCKHCHKHMLRACTDACMSCI